MTNKTHSILPLILIVLLITALFSGCIDFSIGGNKTTNNTTLNGSNTNNTTANTTQNNTTVSKEQISVAAFNIQIFGVSKAGNDDVMDVLAKTIRRYDVVGIQEIRDAGGTSLPKLVDLVNNGTDENGQPYNYDYVVSDRLGRSTSKEQYAYIYDKNTVFVASEPLVYPEPDGDTFEREPYMVTFRSNNGTFDAVFILIHTKPEDAKNEIDYLDDVVKYAKTIYVGQENYVLMGDFNADGSYFNESGPSKLKSDDYIWIIGNDEVTTTKTKNTYDRIVITKELLPYFTNQSGVFNYSAEYELNETQTYAVSDHYPVYIDFWTVVGNWGRVLFTYFNSVNVINE
ncbi:MAG: endonuclease/exonuclease/phosphatase family protein [Methanimicrococcus sp.]|nr:endonuclease/exonuclease/phosphatase family protein [Methanimicrococcus sp.]